MDTMDVMNRFPSRTKHATVKCVMSGTLCLLLVFPATMWAKATTPSQVRAVVRNWLSFNPRPLTSDLRSRSIGRVQAYPGHGDAIYYIVHLKAKGALPVC